MNTKHTRVVVTLLLAISTLATMGLRAPNDHRSPALTADVTPCDLAAIELSAIELLELVDDSCDPSLLDRIESEIGWGTSGRLSLATLLDWALGGSDFGGSGTIDYLEIVEAEEAPIVVAPSIRTDTLVMTRSDYERQVSFVPPEFGPNAAPRQVFIDHQYPSSPWADIDLDALMRSGLPYEGLIAVQEPSSSRAGVDLDALMSSGLPYEGLIDYSNPTSPWADAE